MAKTIKAYWHDIEVIDVRECETHRDMVAIAVNSSLFPCWFWERTDAIELREE